MHKILISLKNKFSLFANIRREKDKKKNKIKRAYYFLVILISINTRKSKVCFIIN